MTPRRTRARLAIAVELLQAAHRTHWGYELSRNAGVGAGSMYPFLAELLEAGHLSDGWESSPPAGRPPRRYYELTETGERFLRDFVASSPGRARRPHRVTVHPNPAAEQ
ncbi:PadR family transcriptional regulator [Pimelobacter simplex]|uniref:PadR family transcriptional regulator n=1 Tax=Nocardioides simplex TaxID=2045 RepID=UPI003830A80B